jgi:hypothetical protein
MLACVKAEWIKADALIHNLLISYQHKNKTDPHDFNTV